MLFCEDKYFDSKQILKQLHVANVALELRHRHNDPKSLELLIEPLESYPELSMIICESKIQKKKFALFVS